MFKIRRFLAVSFVLVVIMTFLMACSSPSKQATPADSSNAASLADGTDLLRNLEAYLNQGEVARALELFAGEAELVEVQPTYLASYESTGTFYTRQLSYSNQVTYRGKDWIHTYLFTLVTYKFQSTNSYFGYEGDQAVWQCEVKLYDARLQVEVKATVHNHKFKLVTLTNLSLTPL